MVKDQLDKHLENTFPYGMPLKYRPFATRCSVSMFLKPHSVLIIWRVFYRLGYRQSVEALQWLA
jgi:hypothetical protein